MRFFANCTAKVIHGEGDLQITIVKKCSTYCILKIFYMMAAKGDKTQ